MLIQIKNLPKSEIEITGEIPAEDFERAYQKSFKELNEKTNIPGFRPGYIPENILVEKMSAAALLELAAETALFEAYPKIIEDHKIEAIGRPKITITKIARKNPLGFKAVTAVLPKINLPDYKKIAGEIMARKENVAVEEKEIDDALEYLRQSAKPKTGSGKEKQTSGQNEKNNLTENRLPELNDEFAKNFGQPDLAGLRNILQNNILEDKKIKARERKKMEALEKIAASAPVTIPELLIEAEKNKMLQELKSSIENMGLKWPDYLEHIKKTEQDLQKDWKNEAEKRTRYAMILREIANIEKIEPSAEDIESYVNQIITQYHAELEKQKIDPVRDGKSEISDGFQKKPVSNGIDKERLKDYAYGIMRNEKVFELLGLNSRTKI
jgi:trigger factor